MNYKMKFHLLVIYVVTDEAICMSADLSAFEPMSGVMEGKQRRMEEKVMAGKLKGLQSKKWFEATNYLVLERVFGDV